MKHSNGLKSVVSHDYGECKHTSTIDARAGVYCLNCGKHIYGNFETD